MTPKHLTRLALALLPLLHAGQASSAAFTWTGPANGSFWDLTQNWNGGGNGRPGAGDTVLLGSADTIIRSSPVSIMRAASVTGTGVLTINPGAAFELSNSASLGGLNLISATYTNAGTALITGPSTLSGASLFGTGITRFTGALTLQGGKSAVNGGTLEMAGSTTVIDGVGLFTGNNARIVNLGSWVDSSNASGSMSGSSAQAFDNQGSFAKTTATTLNFGTAFNNSGSVKLDAGTLSFVSGGASTGRIDIASGATLDFTSSATYDLNRAVNNAGTFQVRGGIVNAPEGLALGGNTSMSGGRLNLSGNSQFDSFDFINGRLDNNGTLLVTGPTTWRGSVFSGTGSIRLAGTLSLNGADTSTLSGGTLVLAGNTTQTGSGSINTSGGRLVNEGVWLERAAGNTSIGGSSAASFDNTGRFSKTSVFTTAIGSSGTAFNNTGTVEVQAGKLQVFSGFNNQGLLTIAAGAELHGSSSDFANAGTLAGDGTVRTAERLSNAGTLAAGGLNDAGTLSLLGGLTQETSGIFLVDLGSTAAGGFDVLTISGAATLAGTLAVNLLDGAHFNVGDSFTVMTWNQRLGNSQFASLDLSQAGGYGFATDYGANSLTLRVTTAVPEPGSWALMAAGLLALGYRARRKSKPAATTTSIR